MHVHMNCSSCFGVHNLTLCLTYTQYINMSLQVNQHCSSKIIIRNHDDWFFLFTEVISTILFNP
jgi:hypothetical protein